MNWKRTQDDPENTIVLEESGDIYTVSYRGLLYKDILSAISIGVFDDTNNNYKDIIIDENSNYVSFTTNLAGIYFLLDDMKMTKYAHYLLKLKAINEIETFLDMPF